MPRYSLHVLKQMLTYSPTRASGEPSPLIELLGGEGIARLAPIFSAEDIFRINTAVDATFKSREDEARAYVPVDEIVSLGLLDTVLGPEMLKVLYAIVPDPVLLHCAMSEIAAESDKPHFAGEQLEGWHRDWETLFAPGDPTHVSVFVYLSDVGPGDGAFEFSPTDPRKRLDPDAPVVSVLGPKGLSFAWNRTFHHRASPNRGKRRRRLLKLSVQPNQFYSRQEGPTKENFLAALDQVPVGNPYIDLLLGRYQGKTAPKLPSLGPVGAEAFSATGRIDVPDTLLTDEQERHLVMKLSGGRIA